MRAAVLQGRMIYFAAWIQGVSHTPRVKQICRWASTETETGLPDPYPRLTVVGGTHRGPITSTADDNA
jgi:hypothetical protein